MNNDFLTIYLKGVADGKDKKKQEIDMLERELYDLQQELNQKNKIIEEIKEYCKSFHYWEDEDGTWHESDFCIDDLIEIIEKGSEE